MEKNRPLSKRTSIFYTMFFMLPIDYIVRDGTQRDSYFISDAANKVTVNDKFDITDPAASYVFSIDEGTPEKTDSEDYVVMRITQTVAKRLSDWIGDSDRRRRKAAAPLTDHRHLLRCGLPMAFISPTESDKMDDPVEIRRRRVYFQMELDKKVRTIGIGYHQLRRESDGEVSYVLYGKPEKKSEQLLKAVAATFGKKSGHKMIVFCDLSGQFHHLDTANNRLSSGKTPCFEGVKLSRSFPPVERFCGMQISLRRRNSFVCYCNECWDEESQTYRFDHRYDRYF